MVTIQEFISQKQPVVRQFTQQTFTWSAYKHNQFLMEHTDFSRLIHSRQIPEQLHRDWILEQFKNRDTYYIGFVSAMMWGGINDSRPLKGYAGDLRTTNFYRALTTPTQRIIDNLDTAKHLIAQNRLKEVFQRYLQEDFKIDGIGESYFTKLLFFAGYHSGNPIKPLIFDKWTKIMHVWLLLSTNEHDRLFKFYKKSSICQNVIQKPGLLTVNRGDEADAYVDYVARMNQLAQHFGVEVSNLESYLFGLPMLEARYRLPQYNPRVFMLHQIDAAWKENGFTCY